jgi:hypothetical protein
VSGSTSVYEERASERNRIRVKGKGKEKTFAIWLLSPTLMHTEREKET